MTTAHSANEVIEKFLTATNLKLPDKVRANAAHAAETLLQDKEVSALVIELMRHEPFPQEIGLRFLPLGTHARRLIENHLVSLEKDAAATH